MNSEPGEEFCKIIFQSGKKGLEDVPLPRKKMPLPILFSLAAIISTLSLEHSVS